MVDLSKHAEYFNAVVELAIVYYNNYLVEISKATGERCVTQQTQGSRSWTFATNEISLDNDGLTERVKALLPYPSVRAY